MLPDIANGWYFSDVTSVFSLIAPDPQNTGFAAITAVGLVLGLLGGGGSILALPIFMLAFEHPTDVAMAESLAVVSVGAAVGFVSHLRAGTVDLSVALPFAALAMTGSYFGSQAAVGVPQAVRLALFFMIAVSSSTVMLRSALRELRVAPAAAEPDAPALAPAAPGCAPPPAEYSGGRRFGPLLAAQAAFVGALTAVTGTGGGFLVVPALTALAGLPVRPAAVVRPAGVDPPAQHASCL